MGGKPQFKADSCKAKNRYKVSNNENVKIS